MKNIGLSAADDAAPDVDTGLLVGWLNRTDLARELTLSVDTLQRWETRRVGPPCVRVGRKVLTAWRPSETGCASRRPARRVPAALCLVGVEGGPWHKSPLGAFSPSPP